MDDEGLDDMDLNLDYEGNESFVDGMDVDGVLDDDNLNGGDLDDHYDDDAMIGGLSAAAAKRQSRTNAKSVECFDMSGKLLRVFPSGSSAAHALGIAQGDISLCCRYLKDSVGNYRFRFHGDNTDVRESAKIKRGYRLVDGSETSKSEIATRTTRASRGEYGAGTNRNASESSLRFYLAPPEHRSRNWSLEEVSVGPFAIKKWVPDHPEVNNSLQEHKLRIEEGGTSKRGRQARRTR